jgi:hypothetical protein
MLNSNNQEAGMDYTIYDRDHQLMMAAESSARNEKLEGTL